ncbi:MAG: hypothetical protein WAK56_08385 [Candidatus Sulfotelmatobacter sp.]|jgi:hypothetical protein
MGDTQVVELLGRARLCQELLNAGLELAEPMRDRGVDLIAYADRSDGGFRARPLQMKVSSRSAFGIHRKYERTADLILVFVWYIEEPSRAVTYALTYAEAVEVATAMRWTETESWRKGSYSTSAPSAELINLLERFRTSPERWKELIVGRQVSAAAGGA